jgi:NAD(P)-dependent dehydrogenase (short-subunit alcohol dehydrogenase family)
MTNKQTILVTGATGNIGGGAAVALAKRGARVVLLGRRLETLEARADSIRVALSEEGIEFQNTDIATLVIDFSDMKSVRRATAEALNRFPKIHGLILSVGVLKQNGPHILPSSHELMFATNVMGPFLFTQLLLERMQQSDGLVLHVDGLVLHVINPERAVARTQIDWDDLESIKNHRTMDAFNRTKKCNQVIAGELARRYTGKISSVAFDPTYIIDKSDPELAKRWPSGELAKRWPSGLTGFFWKIMTALMAKPPAVAGESIANLMLSYQDRDAINSALFKLDKRIEKPDKAMNDEALGKHLWDELERLTGLTS